MTLALDPHTVIWVLVFLVAGGVPVFIGVAGYLGVRFLEPVQQFLRDFEWTWTKAALAALGLWIFGMIFIVVIPSSWVYFASNTLNWRETRLCDISFLKNCGFWLFKLRDVFAAAGFSQPFVLLIIGPYYLQKQRRRLRSESESRPIGGYR